MAEIDTSLLLVTPEELEAAALKSLNLTAADLGDGEAMAYALADAQAAVEGHLQRRLHVARHTSAPGQSGMLSWRWEVYPARWLWYAAEWPVLWVATIDDAYVEVDAGGRFIYSTLSASPVTYIAGYRGRGVTLDDLLTVGGLDDLAVLPPEVPADIHRAIVELALIYLNRASKGLLGTGSVRQQVGSQSVVTVEAVDRDAERRILNRLGHHRRVH
jgi:hypothetical protein